MQIQKGGGGADRNFLENKSSYLKPNGEQSKPDENPYI